jgi:hypothetical protein
LISRAREDLTDARGAARGARAHDRRLRARRGDLDIRGGGQLLGTRQSGLTDLKFAHLRKDGRCSSGRGARRRARRRRGPLRDEVERVDLSAG